MHTKNAITAADRTETAKIDITKNLIDNIPAFPKKYNILNHKRCLTQICKIIKLTYELHNKGFPHFIFISHVVIDRPLGQRPLHNQNS